jgi:hypothetical protein
VKLLLKLLFGGIFIWMAVMTIRTCLVMSLWDAWPGYAANPWAVATLLDVYFGFLTFYLWVTYKERKIGALILWFLLIMGLGNIATSLYILIQLLRLRQDELPETILWSRTA